MVVNLLLHLLWIDCHQLLQLMVEASHVLALGCTSLHAGAIVKVDMKVQGELVKPGLGFLTGESILVEQVLSLCQKRHLFSSLTNPLDLAPPLHHVLFQQQDGERQVTGCDVVLYVSVQVQ